MKADAIRRKHWETVNQKKADKAHECWTAIINGQAV